MIRVRNSTIKILTSINIQLPCGTCDKTFSIHFPPLSVIMVTQYVLGVLTMQILCAYIIQSNVHMENMCIGKWNVVPQVGHSAS